MGREARGLEESLRGVLVLVGGSDNFVRRRGWIFSSDPRAGIVAGATASARVPLRIRKWRS